jgi:hypothetical protein
MNHHHPARIAVLLLPCLIASCATLRTYSADLSAKPKGVRIYPPKVYLLVDTEKERSHLIYLPDFARAYDVAPVAVLAEHQFAVEVDGGMLRSLTSKQDPTAFLTFVKEAGTLGAGAAGVPVSKETFEGTFGLPAGIYILNDNGRFEPIQGPAAP